MAITQTRAEPEEVGRLDALAYTGTTYHSADCPRIAKAAGAHVTFAARAVTNRVPCPTCFPHGVRVTR